MRGHARNHRALLSTVAFATVAATTIVLVVTLGSAAQATPSPASSRTRVAATTSGPPSQLFAADGQNGDAFGWSVSISGSTAVVGAPYAQDGAGVVYVFTDAGGTWTQEAELTASDGMPGDRFGWSVWISGSTIVVGAPYAYYEVGAAYVFTDSGGTWTQQAKLTASDSGGGDKFGYSVVASAATVVVGADGHDATEGAAYVFTDTGGTWSQEQELTAADGAYGDEFGWSLTLSGAILAVSAVKHDGNGAVYVFGDTGGTWSQRAELTAADGAANDYFGDKIALSGTRLVVGAPGHAAQKGAAYVFADTGRAWSQQAELTASDGAPGNCFGWAVGLSGRTVLVAAELHDSATGAAYVFKATGRKWRQRAELTAAGGEQGDEFGYSATLSGTTALIGADQYEESSGTAAPYEGPGTAYVYTKV